MGIAIRITNKEGGEWFPIELNITEDALENICNNRANWVYLPDMPNKIYGGHLARTVIHEEGQVHCFLAAAIEFPNKRIWDSYFMMFRDEYVPDFK